MQTSQLKVIVGSTRETRAADLVVPWITRRARRREAFAVEVLDLRDWPLPFFSEHRGTIGNVADPTYSIPLVKQWNQKIAEGDAFLFITAEYNHGIPGVLKNAIDTVWLSLAFRNKPAAFAAYSSGIAAGARAVEQLALIAIEAELIPLRNSVLIPKVGTAFTADHEPVDPDSDVALDILLDDLAWWARLLQQARRDGVVPPAGVRRQQALAARQQAR